MPKRTIDATGLPDAENTTGSTHAPKKLKSEKVKNVIEDANKDSSTDGREAKAARKEKKRLKKLKKAEAEGNATSAENIPKEESSTEEATSNAKADAKTARKAEKARLKALKKAEKSIKEATTNGTSVIPTDSVNGTAHSQSVDDSYTEDSALAALSQTEIDKFLADNFISITDPKSSTMTFRPILNFSYLPVSDPAQRTPFKAFKAPTPIQAAAWPYLLAGRDVIGVAETGSGKTMAFAVPCVRHILSLPEKQRNKGARAVIVSPTRELAMQSYEQIMLSAKVSGLQAVCVYGGVPKDEQRKALKTADIVVATPGRLNDLINEGCADLSRAKYVVLDEADRMLDKGFEEEIRKIINTTSIQRQTLMFTATWPESVRELASTFMVTPLKIAIGDNPTGDLRANTRIEQRVEVVDPRNKEYRLLQLLKQYQSGSQQDDRILVFALYKKEATRVEGFIRAKGFRVAGIHGDLSQDQRTKSLDAFKQGKTPILVATDVAARGLDIPAVKLVINCTFPLTVEDYVHRIGRTGRAGKEGLAITLFTEHDKAQSGS
jgi:ATP-dependent RNA helicase DBP3